jgi:magnesium-transporting ATPase (P-type)
MEENKPLFGLEVDSSATNSLKEAARWSRIIGIILLSSIALFILFFIAYGAKLNETMDELTGEDATQMITILVLVFVLCGGVIGTLAWFLINGANKIKKGLYLNDQSIFNAGLANIRNYFIMYGILAILSLMVSIINLF